jgi:hypothetical protein
VIMWSSSGNGKKPAATVRLPIAPRCWNQSVIGLASCHCRFHRQRRTTCQSVHNANHPPTNSLRKWSRSVSISIPSHLARVKVYN